MDVSPEIKKEDCPCPTEGACKKTSRKKAKSATRKKREPNQWMKHLSAWRAAHPEECKTMKVGQIATEARKTYQPTTSK